MDKIEQAYFDAKRIDTEFDAYKMGYEAGQKVGMAQADLAMQQLGEAQEESEQRRQQIGSLKCCGCCKWWHGNISSDCHQDESIRHVQDICEHFEARSK